MVLKDSSETKVTFMQLGAMGRNQEVESVETYYDLDIGIATFELHAYIRKSHKVHRGRREAYEDMDSRFAKF